MTKQPLDLSKLLGFDAIAETKGETVDFHADAIAARLGAKVGVSEAGGAPVTRARG